MTTSDRDQLHVVMAVATGIAQDARVRKTAQSVAKLGYRVTLVWGDTGGHERIDGTLGEATTLGLPVHYVLRDRQARRRATRRLWRPRVPAYRSKVARDEAVAKVAAKRSRRTASAGGTRRDALSSRVVSARSALFVRQEAFVGRVQNKLDRRRIANKGKVQWRRELANITDLDAAFTDVLCGLNPDVLHIHDIHLLGAGVVAKARLQAAGRHVPLIYDAHEYIAGMKSRQLLAEAAYLAMEHELVPSVDAIITVSEPIAVRIQQDYGLAERPTVVLNVPPLADIAVSSRNLREEVGVGGAPLLVYSGVLGVQRNVRSVISALPLLPGAHFAVVCVPSPDAPAARQLAVLAEEIGVADRFHLVAPVPTNEIVSFLSTADVGIHPLAMGLPNHELALPNKIFDYLHAGLPVATSRVALLSQLIKDTGIGETFDPEDPQDIAAAVERILGDQDTYAARVQDKDLLSRFSWEAQEANLRDVYDAVGGSVALPKS